VTNYNADRRGLTPLYGLIIMGLAAILLEFPGSWDGLSSYSLPGHEVGRGNCMYRAFQAEECLGAIFFEQPASIPRIFESMGLPHRAISDASHEKIPCNRAIKLDRNLRVTSIEKIRGTSLISAGKRVDVNLADLEDLTAVPGIGPRLAEKIIDQRAERGRFSSINELTRIQGIGKKKLAGWAPYIEAGASGVTDNRPEDIQTSGRLLDPSGRVQK